jgi:hypothetical protein
MPAPSPSGRGLGLRVSRVPEGARDALFVFLAPFKEACPRPVRWRAFPCGHSDLVLSLRKKLFLAGLSLKDVHADAFLPSTPPPQAGAGVTAGASDSSR